MTGKCPVIQRAERKGGDSRRPAPRPAPKTELFGTFCSDAADIEARSMLAFSLLIGSHFMVADHGPRSRAEVLDLAATWLLA
jgi:hypothetical protein